MRLEDQQGCDCKETHRIKRLKRIPANGSRSTGSGVPLLLIVETDGPAQRLVLTCMTDVQVTRRDCAGSMVVNLPPKFVASTRRERISTQQDQHHVLSNCQPLIPLYTEL